MATLDGASFSPSSPPFIQASLIFFFFVHPLNLSLNLSFSYIEGESMLMAMKDIALSSGSACTSASLEPSYVLRALGMLSIRLPLPSSLAASVANPSPSYIVLLPITGAEDDMAHSSIRFGIGRFTTESEIDFVTDKIVAIVERELISLPRQNVWQGLSSLIPLGDTGLRDLSPLWEMVQEGIDIKSIDWSQH